MCGVPVHAAEAYLARLIKAGHRVAIAEQTESPAEARKARGSKALVERAIVRLVTPGTLTEETLLELGRGQLAGGGRPRRRRLGDRRRRHFDRAVRAGRLRAGRAGRRAGATVAGRDRSPTAPVPGIATTAGKGGFDSLAGERALKSRFGLATLDGFGAPVARRTGRRRRPARLSRRDPEGRRASCSTRRAGSRASSHMAIDAATRDSLELTRSVTGRRRRQPARRDRPLPRPPPAAACWPRTLARR